MPPIGSRHAAVVERFARRFHQSANGFLVRTQQPLLLNSYSEPVPDFSLVRLLPDYHVTAHPTPAEVLLTVEVADTTLQYDLDEKAPLYAESAVPELWIVDLTRREVIRFADPKDGSYREREVASAAAHISPMLLPEAQVAVSEVLMY